MKKVSGSSSRVITPHPAQASSSSRFLRCRRSEQNLATGLTFWCRMPTTPHIEKHFSASALVRDIVIGMADGLTVPFRPCGGPFTSKVQIVVVYKIPWGVDSDQFWGQTEVANPLNLEATNATRSPLRRTDRYPNQSWRNFRLIGTQLFNLADHVAVAWRRREDVEAQRLGWGHRCAAVALFGTQAEGVRANGAILPDHRHSRGGTGWLLDSSGAAERGNRELRCRCGLDCDVTPPAAGQDPQDRRRGFGACATGVQTRRSACLRHSQRADA